jgi:hypothetical protein
MDNHDGLSSFTPKVSLSTGSLSVSRSLWTLSNLTRSAARSFYTTHILVGSIVAVSCITAVSDPESSPPYSLPPITITSLSSPLTILIHYFRRHPTLHHPSQSSTSLLWTTTRSTAHPKPSSKSLHSEEVLSSRLHVKPTLLYLVLG